MELFVFVGCRDIVDTFKVYFVINKWLIILINVREIMICSLTCHRRSFTIEKHLMKTKWLAAFFRRLEFFSWAATQTAVFFFYTARAIFAALETVCGRISYRVLQCCTVCNVMWCSSFSIKIEIFKHSTGNFCIHKNSLPPSVRVPFFSLTGYMK